MEKKIETIKEILTILFEELKKENPTKNPHQQLGHSTLNAISKKIESL